MNFSQIQGNLDALLATHFSGFDRQVHCWQEEFDFHQCVRIGNLIPHPLQASLHTEARRLLAEKSERRNVNIASTGNTPRSYRSVGRDAIREAGLVTPALFHSDILLMLLSTIAGEPVYRVPYAPEEYIINNQCGHGDTHGWHWDDSLSP
ncbi:HalD/BesD family halogenase [Variovorax sp. DT-64]|uniref:HalD/BesD family halogenase n=1 Tax=Variovorax sp. DT-64 TaxID=3396160 RepID=UPI003F1AD854